VLGGALGNLLDRVFRAPGFLRGGVVDFVSLFDEGGRVWPVFNVADSCLVAGVCLLVLLVFRGIQADGTRPVTSADLRP
jgi:signal peptidase II